MLLSLSRRFIFVANLKTASTSIEACLRPFSEICIPSTRFGKHEPLAKIEERFSWAFDYIGRANFFVFGVIRDPLDYVLSIYNSHQKPAFLNQPSYTGGIAFEDFYSRWRSRGNWQLAPQYERFLNAKGEYALDYLLNLDDVPTQWPQICKVLDLPEKELRNLNVSPTGASRAMVDPGLAAQIYRDYATDDLLAKEFTGFTACRGKLALPE
jgi:hypothetical protein